MKIFFQPLRFDSADWIRQKLFPVHLNSLCLSGLNIILRRTSVLHVCVKNSCPIITLWRYHSQQADVKC
jgi:hypothetical protein